jgi:hypothetical protein
LNERAFHPLTAFPRAAQRDACQIFSNCANTLKTNSFYFYAADVDAISARGFPCNVHCGFLL